MKLSVRFFPRIFLTAACLAGMASAASSQQPSPSYAANERFYAVLAKAARLSEFTKTKKMGGGGGGKFVDVAYGGGILVGFEVWQGDYSGHVIIRGIRPIYLTAQGRVPGDLHGQKSGIHDKVEAKDGYAVAAIEPRGGDRLDGFQVLFWKIRPFDVSLDAEGAYKSDWLGGKGGGRSRHPLASNGNPVIGISGASGDDVDRLGLIYCQRP